MSETTRARSRTGRRRGSRERSRDTRSNATHRQLRYPYPPRQILGDDQVESIHREAKRFLQEHGIRILFDEARDLLAAAGAGVGTTADELAVRIPEEMVDRALEAAPSTFTVRGTRPNASIAIGGDSAALLPVGGPPFVSDLDAGRRPGTLADYENFVRLTRSFDVLHANAPFLEAQDIPIQVRHLYFVRSQIALSEKVPFLFSRGRQRVADVLEMLRINSGLTKTEFRETPMCYSVVNTNSPRQIDIPMAAGIIDLARNGQPCVITPFTLAGAMAPVSLGGALLLQHLELLAGVTLAQTARPGAPVVYGAFTSNVDMRTGSPAFGTPETMRAAMASGQLARHTGLPWRSSGASGSPVEDAQGAWETVCSLEGAMLGGANMILHSAGWQEGGLVASYEKFILDIEILQTLVDSWQPIDTSREELAYDAIASVSPGAHFFGADHTLERFETAFRNPLVATRQTFEQWVEEGSKDSRTRANAVWKQVLADFEAPPHDEAIAAELDDFMARREAEGGAPVG